MKTPIPLNVKEIQPPAKPVDHGIVRVTYKPAKPVDHGIVRVTYKPAKPVDHGIVRVTCPPAKPVDHGIVTVTVGDATKRDVMRNRDEKERIKNLKDYDPPTEI